jgi:hypothetical protein
MVYLVSQPPDAFLKLGLVANDCQGGERVYESQSHPLVPLVTLGWIGVAKFPCVKAHDWSPKPHKVLE